VQTCEALFNARCKVYGIAMNNLWEANDTEAKLQLVLDAAVSESNSTITSQAHVQAIKALQAVNTELSNIQEALRG
jgi:hypothetical protein